MDVFIVGEEEYWGGLAEVPNMTTIFRFKSGFDQKNTASE